MNFAKFLRTPFLTEHLQWLLLKIDDQNIFFLVILTFGLNTGYGHFISSISELFKKGFFYQIIRRFVITYNLFKISIAFFDRMFCIKVSEYPFKQNRNTLKNIKVLLCTYFYNISFNVLGPTFFNICNFPFPHLPNIKKIRAKVGPKTNYFSYFMSSCTDRIAVFNIFFSLTCSQPRDKQNGVRDFIFFKYFLNNLLLTVFMQNVLSRLAELLQ